MRWIWVLGVFIALSACPLYRLKNQSDLVNLGLDLKGGTDVIVKVKPYDPKQPLTDSDISGVMGVFRKRLDPQGVREILVQRRGGDRVEIQIPGEKEPDRVRNLIGKTAKLDFVYTGETGLTEGTEVTEGQYKVIATGADLKKSELAYDNLGRPAVGFEFKGGAARTFGTFTDQHQGDYLTIVLDGTVISSPVIRAAIYGSGIIEGGNQGFTLEEASDLVALLNAGALPAQVEILSLSVVGPTLGKSSIDQSIKAGTAGLILVIALMIIFYRMNGVAADLALLYYAAIMFFIIITFNVTLTIYGIAAFILNLGMAVDANVLIFERFREEFRAGKTLLQAAEAGHRGALPAILDSHVTTILSAVVLYWLGTGTIKGFAVMLALGMAVNLFSALVVTRALVESLVGTSHNTKLYGI
ncbi:MAG: protein translocase subunit SecD [bacterium]